MKTIDAARGKWDQLLPQLGIDLKYLRKNHGPCPVCGGRDRFRYDNRKNNGEWYCNQCVPNSGNGINLLMSYHGWDFVRAASEVDQIVGNIEAREQPEQKRKDPLIRLRKVREGLQELNGINPVSLYLRNRDLPKNSYLKYHPKQAFYQDGAYQGSFPAMVAVFHSPEGKPLTFHITYLTKHGTKADVSAARKMLPAIAALQGGAIRLSEPAKVMGIAEGIETALACTKLFGIPTWAAFSANILEEFIPPSICEHLVIFGDNDTSFTGQKSTYVLANKLAVKGFSVEVRIANNVGQDWADELRTAERLK